MTTTMHLRLGTERRGDFLSPDEDDDDDDDDDDGDDDGDDGDDDDDDDDALVFGNRETR